jgi:hypothetical protein
MIKKMAVGLCFVGLLVGCSTTPPKYWQHPSIPSSEWGSDLQRCKRATDKYLGKQERYQVDMGMSQDDSYAEQMRVYEVGKKQKELVGECMYKLGYSPIK